MFPDMTGHDRTSRTTGQSRLNSENVLDSRIYGNNNIRRGTHRFALSLDSPEFHTHRTQRLGLQLHHHTDAIRPPLRSLVLVSRETVSDGTIPRGSLTSLDPR
jgi:hypothetical protein